MKNWHTHTGQLEEAIKYSVFNYFCSKSENTDKLTVSHRAIYDFFYKLNVLKLSSKFKTDENQQLASVLH